MPAGRWRPPTRRGPPTASPAGSRRAKGSSTRYATRGGDDVGVEDKRLLVMENEFAAVLKVIERQGNTLSPVLRHAWKGGELRTMVKTSAARCARPHISTIGHITPAEFRRY